MVYRLTSLYCITCHYHYVLNKYRICHQRLPLSAEELVTGAIPFDDGVAVDISLLIGSGAQSIEFFPGPRDLKNWTWHDYTKYVTTSLDSFGPKLSQLALELYPAEISEWNFNDTNNATQYTQSGVKPDLLYATMVGDLRQTCPVDMFAKKSFSNTSSPLYRYIVNNQPSSTVIKHA